MPDATVLQLTAVRKSVRLPDQSDLTILDGVDVSVEAGSSTSIIGRSGSGKSTLLAIMGLLATPTSGQVRIAGEDTATLNDAGQAALRNRSIGFIFQNYSLMPTWTILQNCCLPMLYQPRTSARQATALAREQLAALGMADRADALPRHLSGGEQQRVAIARALVNRPAIVLADEPTGALDETTAASVLGLFFQAVADAGASLVIVTHDQEVAARASRRLELVKGRLQPC